ncbi:MAG: 2OG-Fe(II) oxygenase family protein, partial [Litorimonas sp.]
VELPPGDPLADLPYYAPNLWPTRPKGFREAVEMYLRRSRVVALDLLGALAVVLGAPRDAFAASFDRPMTLLRANWYPPRPSCAGARDFGIAEHTDYGCLTLLATDGSPGLEVRARNGTWLPVTAPPGEFVINFGEMLESWSGGRVLATPHRVIGGAAERVSIPLFFNPGHDANVAPPGAPPLLAGAHLSARYNETYLHIAADRNDA